MQSDYWSIVMLVALEGDSEISAEGTPDNSKGLDAFKAAFKRQAKLIRKRKKQASDFAAALEEIESPTPEQQERIDCLKKLEKYACNFVPLIDRLTAAVTAMCP